MENEREDGGSEETRKMRPLGRGSQRFVYYSLTCFLFLLFLVIIYTVIAGMDSVVVLSFQYCMKLCEWDDLYVCMVPLFLLAFFFFFFMHEPKSWMMA